MGSTKVDLDEMRMLARRKRVMAHAESQSGASIVQFIRFLTSSTQGFELSCATIKAHRAREWWNDRTKWSHTGCSYDKAGFSEKISPPRKCITAVELSNGIDHALRLMVSHVGKGLKSSFT